MVGKLRRIIDAFLKIGESVVVLRLKSFRYNLRLLKRRENSQRKEREN